MEFLISSSISIVLILVILAIILASVILVIFTEYRRRNGNFDLTSVGWIILSVLLPVIVPIIYLIAGKR